jgi:Na+-driven multidrug efflux pump
MSLIDTICIGNCGSVLELAAAGPATLLFGAASSLFSALTATALSDISTSLARGRTVVAAAAFGGALRAAGAMGVAVAVVFSVFSAQAVGLLGLSTEVVPTAARYLALRGLAAPAAKGIAVCAVRTLSLVGLCRSALCSRGTAVCSSLDRYCNATSHTCPI